MALVKPRINPIIAFDAFYGSTITFIASGGDQVVKNEIKIITNDEESYLEYQNTVTSYALSHTIPSGVLRNGKYYKIAVRTYNIANDVSEWSNYQPFYCYSTPIVSFNINNNQDITDPNFVAVLTYNQYEDEKVDYAFIELFDANNNPMRDSGYLYNSTLPPLYFNYLLTNLDNNTNYKIKGKIVTINGTTILTDTISFHTNYEAVPSTETLTATLDNCKGYVNLRSSIIKNFEGISYPADPIYIDNEEVDLTSAVADINKNLSRKVEWVGAVNPPKSFLFRLWFYPAREKFNIVKFYDTTETAYLTISFNRSNTTDYLSIRTENGTVIDHDLGVICNGRTKVFLWLKIIDDVWTVTTNIMETTPTTLVWNDTPSNNVLYNITSDIAWGNETKGNFVPNTSVYRSINVIFNNLVIGNGIFDELNLTRNTDLPYSAIVPDYDEDTILSVSFNGTLRNNSPYYTKFILKRKDINTPNWLNISEIIPSTPNIDYSIDFNDAFIPTDVQQTYALVTYIDGAESAYSSVSIVPHWDKVFLSDRNNRFVLNYAVIYSNHSQNTQNGVLMPIGTTYPIVIQNAEGNYRSGSLQFKVLGYQYEINQRLNRESITREVNDILAFLTNGKPKCITDYNGNVFICKVINSPQVSYDSNWGNGIATISFDWVEQSKYNDYENMLGIGLFDYIGD